MPRVVAKGSLLSKSDDAPPAGGAGSGMGGQSLAATVAAQVEDPEILQKFIVNLTKALIDAGAQSQVASAADASFKDSMAAMNVLSDYESEDDSHLFSQQQ